MSITSDELNYLVFRYLSESGFAHTAYTFGHESLVARSNLDGSAVPPGALVSYVQKGLQYLEVETHLREDGSEIECDEPFALLMPHQCKVKKRRRRRKAGEDGGKSEGGAAEGGAGEGGAESKPAVKVEVEEDDGVAAMELTSSLPHFDIAVRPPEAEEVLAMTGHKKDVFSVAFCPKDPSLLASGSGDSTARLWVLPDELSSGLGDNAQRELRHAEKLNDVMAMAWAPDGGVLATGALDGNARLWSASGELMKTLSGHTQPIFSIEWSPSSSLVLTGSADCRAIVWDAASGAMKQEYELHSAPTLSVAWRDENVFATCSSDRSIYLCEVGNARPLVQFYGHHDEVNNIAFDPTGQLLASCSDDHTAKIWTASSETCVLDLNAHRMEIFTVAWSPLATSGAQLLATASQDSTVKIWDITAKRCLYDLTDHTDSVYSVKFSPDGRYVATGSTDATVKIWSVTDGSLVRSYSSDGGIFEVTWAPDGSRIASAHANGSVVVLDVRK
ncbi:uncharacterized protein AMSG_02624 [Thecamonas trahens ATCC 50062]|uniref:Uncharacterized protein n=1 Tax=Thecamonas trahens ATCC 50062 TaxID=461836 RepID=A0A0L0D5I4_THETB|nr:hypothetical protein AMSG_02624 [Thecamonas trahens ATCC 50062]KNC47599.1 hypothetical protein AMSG_02624 [Thecamonas trahens ATCC 50062]|eukprot:XP_013759526.1 hypothetical protein AMSG_02624 [Thecamonas trahens ATCC 50062]